MLKDIVGDWGSELDDADYARALTALGVLESTGAEQHAPTRDAAALAQLLEQEFHGGERTPIWRSAQNVNPSTTPASWRATVHRDAAVLAAAWQRYRGTVAHPRRAPRLAVALDWRSRHDLFDFDALRVWLEHPAVGLDAVVVADAGSGQGRVAWHWPLRVGVPAGQEHAKILAGLRAARDQTQWIGRLSECYPVGAGRDACDLLILTKAAAQRVLEQPRTRIRASFVVCLDEPRDDPAGLIGCSVLRERLRAAGVALIGRLDPSPMLREWFEALLRGISHDLPIHGAIGGSMRRPVDRNALVLGSPPALDQCRIVAIAEHQDCLISALTPPPPVAARSNDSPLVLRRADADAGVASPASELPPPTLADALRGRSLIAESVDGIDAVQDLRDRGQRIDQARPPRWIQTDAWRGDAPALPARALAPAQWNLLAVHIGPTEETRHDAPFPDRHVEFRGGEVDVTVQLELAGAAVTPLDHATIAPVLAFGPVALRPDVLRSLPVESAVLLSRLLAQLAPPPGFDGDTKLLGLAAAAIRLPPAGNSTPALFAVRPGPGVGNLEGRIAIIHNNRVLQTARIMVEVRPEADSGAGIVLGAEATIHDCDDDLEERREYDVAIQVSDVGSKLHLTIQRGGTSTPVQLDDLHSSIAAIRAALEFAAKKWDYAKPMLEQAVFDDMVYTLAAHGCSLQQYLRKTCGDDIDRWERIHLVPSTIEFLPLEYVYDGPPPTTDARVCPNMRGALQSGGCERALTSPGGPASCPNSGNTAFVCPMHFWGFRRLIERDGTVRAAPPATPDRSPPPRPSTPSRQPYGKVGAVLFAASQRAFAYVADPAAQAGERTKLLQALHALAGKVADAPDWHAWRSQAREQPNLLVLVAHTDKVRGAPALEIGDGKFLGDHEILPDISGAGGQPQLLILLGCSAAGVTENFQPYPERFRDAGVSIVLAPVAPIRGADAVPIARRLAALLAARLGAPEPTAFGELLPLLRRELLHDGHPGVMGIVGFGDGDWLLGGG